MNAFEADNEKIGMVRRVLAEGIEICLNEDGEVCISLPISTENNTIVDILTTFSEGYVNHFPHRGKMEFYLCDVTENMYEAFKTYVTGRTDIPDTFRPVLDEFEKFNYEFFELIKKRRENIKKTGNFAFFDIRYAIYPDDEIVILSEFNNQMQGGKVKRTFITYVFGLKCIGIRYTHTLIHDGRIKTNNAFIRIPMFTGIKSGKDLNLRFLTEDDKKVLENRAKKANELINGAHFMEYKGTMFRRTWLSLTSFKSDGRVMIDSSSFSKFEPDYPIDISSDDDFDEDLSYTLAPTIPGYSMRLKRWGEFLIEDLSPVTYHKEAFDLLVMDAQKKKIIRSLIESKTEFNDIIVGKGGGMIFMLHGTPGVGKTLTAEAVSEILERPLYMITIGELGTSAQELESKLYDILELATVWNAILLIDEADIFLEKRTTQDIERNAMVGVFLRLLEYYTGVLFLTTNRINCIDEAFVSRISLVIKYDELNEMSRFHIWKNLIEAQKVSLPDEIYHNLAMHKLNGRQIKNMIRMSMLLAAHNNEELSEKYIDKILPFMAHNLTFD